MREERRRSYLAALGIDVWVRRSKETGDESAAAVAALPDTLQQPHVESTGVAAHDPHVRTPESDAAGLNLVFVQYSELTVVASLPSDAAAMPSDLQQLIDDLAQAAGEDRRRRRLTNLRPHPDRPFAGDLAAHVADLGCQRMLVLDDDLSALMPANVSTFMIPSQNKVYAEPATKREIWGRLQQWMAPQD